jgi:type II secretory pathway component PulM
MATLSTSPRWFALRDAWIRKSPRERILIGIAIALTSTTLAWLLLVRPLASDSARAQRDLARDTALLSVARLQAQDIGKLGQSNPGRSTVEPRQALERVLGEQGLRAAVTSLDVADGRVRVTFAAVRFEALLAMLDALAQADSLRPVEMTLTPRVEPGTVRAELALSR